MDSLSLYEAVDLVETTRDTVDDVWRQTEYDPYPQPRMQNLLDVIGKAGIKNNHINYECTYEYSLRKKKILLFIMPVT